MRSSLVLTLLSLSTLLSGTTTAASMDPNSVATAKVPKYNMDGVIYDCSNCHKMAEAPKGVCWNCGHTRCPQCGGDTTKEALDAPLGGPDDGKGGKRRHEL